MEENWRNEHMTSPPVAASGPGRERDNEKNKLDVLKKKWTNPNRLHSGQKMVVKTIKSLEQGYNGTIARCCFCNQLGSTETDMHVHHINHIISDNRLENLDVAHARCNTIENAAYMSRKMKGDAALLEDQVSESVREKNGGGAAPTTDVSRRLEENRTRMNKHIERYLNERDVTSEANQWGSKEGAKHDAQRFAYNNWLTDLENGPFKGVNTRLYPKVLAKMAPWGIGRYVGMDGPLGSSVTYRRFIEEDKAGGILGVDVDELGKETVYLNYVPKTGGEKKND